MILFTIQNCDPTFHYLYMLREKGWYLSNKILSNKILREKGICENGLSTRRGAGFHIVSFIVWP
ncbi:hypothetical protein HanXRQr2_Chr15g0671361 [Helianthus annuus]|uniref:Uncharacterized protein n=1 Tax=Helianthus annuus TaxID=4232 RepID=A0A9K3DW87_HELAN|nr:hypothetical protein HanXRQr2_Chr15g0671361 [Helianthus annuus]